jgi:hypothetical protein
MADVCRLVPVHSDRWHYSAWNKLAVLRLTFEQCKWILKCYWKRRMRWMRCKGVGQMSLQHQHSLQLQGNMIRLGMMEQCNMWSRNALKISQFSWQWKCWYSVSGLRTVSKKPVWQCCRETGVCETSVQCCHILQAKTMDRVKRNVQIPPRSPDLTPLHIYFWCDLKNSVCTKNQNTAGTEAQN